ncbi:MAG: clostripain-related cysteine peptidase [Candidatus Eremiobacteraeota bacterium]|nr:clostripain-related cysteine peptidase [Candidatus Eremiobacteraeota bacterium]
MNIKDMSSHQMIHQPMGERKPRFPEKLDVTGEPKDQVEIQSSAVRFFADIPDEERTNWRDVVSGALLLTGLVAGSLTGPPSAVAVNAQMSPPAVERVMPNTEAPQRAKDPAAHIISHIDASEHIIEPFATSEMQQLENIKSAQGESVKVDAVMVRDTGNPYVKIGTGGAEGLMILAPSIGGWAISRKKSAAAGLLLMGIGGVLSYGIAKSGLGVEALRNIVSGAADLTSGEPVWNGTRVYNVQPNTTGAIDSKVVSQNEALKPDAKALTDFIASQMKEYPKSTTVVHMVGHGLSYHSSAGFDFKEYSKILNDATEQARRPVDLLVVESCLEGNVEAILGTFPNARYVIVSEESVAAGILPDLMKQALDEQLAQGPAGQERQIDAKQLGESMIKHGKEKSMLSTLALVDMEKVPAFGKSVDTFGTLLAEEAKAGRTAGIAEAVKNTPMYPQGSVTGDMGQKLGMGDLKQFAQNILRSYGDTSTGKGEVSQEASASPKAQEVRQAAREVLDRLGDAVPAVTTSGSYQGAGGLSIQLPISNLEKLDKTLKENKMTTFPESSAPQGWKDFVNAMGPHMTQPAPGK